KTKGGAGTEESSVSDEIDGTAAGKALTLSAANGAGLTANSGDISVGGAVGSGTPLASLAATGTTVGVLAVTTTGDQSYTGTTTIGGDLTSSTAGAITVTGDALFSAASTTVKTKGGA